MKKLIKEILKFVGVSGIGWIIDTIVYLLLSSLIKLNIDISNMISSLVGVTFVFIVSTRKIFQNNTKININIKYIIYIVYQVILILIVSHILLILKEYILTFQIPIISKHINIIVKILITPFTMVINYIVTKYIIEKL